MEYNISMRRLQEESENMNLKLAFSYLRLSIEEEGKIGESSSIANQRMIVQNYCKQHNITIVREFVDDGWSGGNFNRPEFQAMIQVHFFRCFFKPV